MVDVMSNITCRFNGRSDNMETCVCVCVCASECLFVSACLRVCVCVSVRHGALSKDNKVLTQNCSGTSNHER